MITEVYPISAVFSRVKSITQEDTLKKLVVELILILGKRLLYSFLVKNMSFKKFLEEDKLL